PIKLEPRRRSGHGAALTAQGAIGFDSAQRIVAPFFIGLAKRRHSQLDAMEKITAAARREFSFPSPVDVHRERCDEHNKKESDERPAAFQSTQSKRIPVMLSTHEAKNAEIVIRVVRFPRRSLALRRVDPSTCSRMEPRGRERHRWANREIEMSWSSEVKA